MEVKNFCRTCSIKTSSLINIFDNDQTDNIKEMLLLCTSINVIEDEDLPHQICFNCLNELKRFYAFRELTLKSEKFFKTELKLNETKIPNQNNSVSKTQKINPTKSRLYMCNICGKQFGQNWHLKGHLITHSGKRPYECKYCNKSFAAPGTLTTHLRIHTGSKPHSCNLCGKSFVQSSCLKVHMRVHSKEKVAECVL
ncbi:zinc finger protein 32-like isoform X3 [Onthophagus taurus]|uniref:zinc finger protein 32-like isoform X3 n=1 Tax=Onthophagus taurus TaxID=166361 RepID=UPI0039BDAB3C